MNVLKQSFSTLQAWPSDVGAGINYHASRLTSLGDYGESVRTYLEKMPPASLMHAAYGSNQARADEALLAVWAKHGALAIPSHLLNCNVGHALSEADSGPIRVNPVLRHSLLALRDRLLPPNARGASLQENLAGRIKMAQSRYNDTSMRGKPGYSHSRNIMLMLIGLQRVTTHPAFAAYNLTGPTTQRRYFKSDLLSLLGLVVAVGAVPVWVGVFLSARKAGVAMAIISLYVGGALISYKERQQDAADEPPAEHSGLLCAD